MGQRKRPPAAATLANAARTLIGWAVVMTGLLIAAAVVGCDRGAKPAATGSGAATTAPMGPIRVASLVPAATDVIIGMGGQNHLVAVSNYDAAAVNGVDLPHVGDYQSTDWETLATLRPQVLVIQMDEARLPEAFKSRAASLGMKLVNVRPVTLADALHDVRQLGEAIGETDKAGALATKIEQQLDAVRKRSDAQPRVRALVTLDEEGKSLVGPGTYLDDLLTAAGGDNVAKDLGTSWPAADRETLLRLKPDVVLVLRPGAKANYLDTAKKVWSMMPQIPAGRDGRVYLLSEPYALLPGAHLGDVAEWMQRSLHAPPQNGATRP